MKREYKVVKLTPKQANFLWRLLQTHADVCDLEAARMCSAIAKKFRPTSTSAKKRDISNSESK